MTLARYLVVIDAPDVQDVLWDEVSARVRADLPAVMEHVTETIAGILPVGYSVEISEDEGGAGVREPVAPSPESPGDEIALDLP